MTTWIALLALCAFAAHAAPDTMDLSTGWVFQTDPEKHGVDAGWMARDFDDSGWKPIEVGMSWEEQGYPDYDGAAWYRLRFDLPASYDVQRVALLLGGVNDSCTVYCNGALYDSFGDGGAVSMHETAIAAMLGTLLKPGEKNVIAVRVLDWGGRGGLWRKPVQLQDATRLTWPDFIQVRADTENRRLNVDLQAQSFGSKAMTSPLHAVITNGAFRAEQDVAATHSAMFDLGQTATEGTFDVKVSYTDASGPSSGTVQYRWPAKKQWPAPYSSLAVRNNFVTELRDAASDGFVNPRPGWVFFSYSKSGAQAPPDLVLDDETKPLPWRRNPKSNAWEAMRRLGEGRHTLHNAAQAGSAIDIRAIPEIEFCYYPYTYHIAAFGTPDQKFMDEYALADINTIVTHSGEIERDPFFAQWKSEGRAWISNGHLPGLGAPTPPDSRAVADEWLQIPGTANPDYAGLIVDEFTSAPEGHYRAWTDAVQMLHDAPAMRDKMFYAWCVDIYRSNGPVAFCQKLKDFGYTFVWEKYLREEPTLEIADRWINQSIAERLEEWQRVVPGVERNLVVCLGYMSAPPESLDVDPLVDYGVFLDMQFHALANDPRCFGLYGVMAYMSNYADEEYVRYTQRLFRHYCIDGKRERMNADPYILTHVTNPDFAKGLDAWTIDAAQDGSITTDTMDGFSYLEGRYPRYKEGDTYCRMKRVEGKEDRVSQTVRNLTPGRLYSLKMFSANIESMDRNDPAGLEIAIDGVDAMEPLAFDYVFPSSYSHDVPPFNKDHPAYITYHRRVFKAKTDTAQLTLSDRGAPTGQITAFNFVQVQPYHAG